MEFERLEQAWRSQANTPGQQAQAYLMEQLMHALKARRRGEILLFAIPVAAMTFFTAVAGRSILIGQTDLGREWGALAMLAANRRARINFRIFCMSLPIFIVPTLIGVFQLGEAGKATDRNAWQMLLLFGLALGASLGWNTLRFFKVLKPEQRRLEGLLREYDQ
jgi:hypothetical protein